MKIRVAGIQMRVMADIQENRACILRAIERSADARAEILLTPEGSLSGYMAQFDREEAREALDEVRAAAKELRVGLALGTCFVEDDGKCYNEIRFYRPDGAYLGFHSKILKTSSLGPSPEGELNDFESTRLRDFEWQGDFRVGGLICNDLWANPVCTVMPDAHLTQQLAARGVPIIFHAVNGWRSDSELSRLFWQYHESNLRTRALAGKLWIVTVDNAYPTDIRCSAPSGIVGPDGNWLVQAAPTGEQFFCETIDVGSPMKDPLSGI